jgi:hypothetical protein
VGTARLAFEAAARAGWLCAAVAAAGSVYASALGLASASGLASALGLASASGLASAWLVSQVVAWAGWVCAVAVVVAVESFASAGWARLVLAARASSAEPVVAAGSAA